MSKHSQFVGIKDLLAILFPGTKLRKLRWLRYRIADGTMPSEKICSARVFNVEKCRKALERIQGKGRGNPKCYK